MSSVEIEQWIKAAQDGSQEAFRELVHHFQDVVRSSIRRIVPESDVDDLAQDVFVSFARRLGDRRQPTLETPAAWLKSVARNRAISYWRQRGSRKSISTPSLAWLPEHRQDPGVLGNATGNDQAALDLRARQLASLHHCVGLLSASHREILDGFYSLGQSTELLATQSGKGTGAVRMMLVRIRRALAKCIRKQLELLDDELE